MLRTFGYAVCVYLVIKAAHAMARPQLKAVNLLPRGHTRLDPYTVEEQAGIYMFVAEKHGAWLGWGQGPIRRDFDRATRAYLASQAGNSSPQATAALLVDVRRCFNDEWEAHGEILNP
jgi:hypothetical protein